MIGGYLDEARAFRDWLLRAVAGDPADLQIMYDIAGARRLTEFELPWLPGYEGSKPVRVGNAASGQFQLDVYGEMLAAIYAGRKMGLAGRHDAWPPAKRPDRVPRERLAAPRRRHLGGARRPPPLHPLEGDGLGGDRSRRAASIDEFGVGGDEGRDMLPHLSALRERIHAEVCERGFNPRVGAFTQSYGSDDLDASVLVIPHYGFLPAQRSAHGRHGRGDREGPPARRLRAPLRDRGRRRRAARDRRAPSSPAASGWPTTTPSPGAIDEAEALFERLLALRNHLGLFAEEYDPKLRRQIGNFPQAFSHLALISTAHVIESVRQGGEVRAPQRGAITASIH